MAAFRITVLPSGWEFDSDGTRTLMEAAAGAGIILPTSCRNGTCRTCVCRLRGGRIIYKIEWPGLTPEEKREGWILPCVALANSDLVIEAPGARRKDMPRALPTAADDTSS